MIIIMIYALFFIAVIGVICIPYIQDSIKNWGSNGDNSDIYNCTYVNGLGIPECKGRIRVGTEELTISLLSHNYSLNYDKLLSIDEVTKEQSEYVSKAHWGRAIVGGAFLGTPGFLLAGAPSDKMKTTYENYVLISYNKNDTMQFIILKGISCNRLKKSISQYKTLRPQNIEL